MSETITDIGGLRVVVQPDGSASIWDADPSEGSNAIAITADERIAVALALLGGITDELVERGARAHVRRMYQEDIWDEVAELRKTVYRDHIRAVLEAAIGGGGEG